jgi:hypothetical protein
MKLHPGKFFAPTALCLLLAGCAQTGPPLPPSLELPKPPTDLRASRKGNRVTLSWSEPTHTTDRQSVRYLGPTLICRSLDPEIATCANPAAALPAPSPSAAPKKSRRAAQKSGAPPAAPQTYIDTLPASTQQQDPSAEVTYAVEVLNRNARGGGLSNRVHVSAVVTLPPPSDLSAELTGDGVVLTWTSAGESGNLPTNSPASSPAVQHRYRIYRRDESSGKDAIAGEVPVPSSERGPVHFMDSSFEWEKTYLYRITAVTIIKCPDSNSEVQVEGDDTPPVRVIAHDVFPPSVPAGLQAAYSGEGQKPFIDLIWAPVTNADLAGYNVYRSEANGAAGEKTVKLNAELVKSPSYRDFAVASGKTYTYSVSAVDVRGNESQRSEPTSEPVP